MLVMETVAIVVDRFLLDVRTYIYEEITAIEKYHVLVLTRKRENEELYPFNNIYVSQYPRNIFKEYESILYKQNARLIHVKFGTDALKYLPLKRRTGLPFVASFHGYDASSALNNPKILGKYRKFLFPNADHLITVSKKLKDNLIEVGCPEKKITVLWSGIDVNKFSYKPRMVNKNEKIKIFTIARLKEAKGIHYLIDAYAMVEKVRPNTELIIVGQGQLKDHLLRQISNLGLENKISIRNFVPHNKVPDIMHNHHIFCLPSVVSSRGIEEGTPNVLKEACATGMPVVATNHSGIPHVIHDGKNGFLVQERNIEQLSEKLIYLIDHPEIWEEMGVYGRKHIEQNFDKKGQAKKLENIYQGLIKAYKKSK